MVDALVLQWGQMKINELYNYLYHGHAQDFSQGGRDFLDTTNFENRDKNIVAPPLRGVAKVPPPPPFDRTLICNLTGLYTVNSDPKIVMDYFCSNDSANFASTLTLVDFLYCYFIKGKFNAQMQGGWQGRRPWAPTFMPCKFGVSEVINAGVHGHLPCHSHASRWADLSICFKDNKL